MRTIDQARAAIKPYGDKQLVRMHRRIWAWIEKHYGTGAWDWPTLYAVFPDLACHHAAICKEMRERKEHEQARQADREVPGSPLADG